MAQVPPDPQHRTFSPGGSGRAQCLRSNNVTEGGDSSRICSGDRGMINFKKRQSKGVSGRQSGFESVVEVQGHSQINLSSLGVSSSNR